MRNRIALSLSALLGAAIFLVAGVGSAQTEQRVALVIGNSAYKESPLANPGNDAADMARALGELGFKVILRRNTNTRALREAVREFGKELRRAQVGLFYYAGHGVQIRGSNYLVPVGADIRGEADVEDQAIDATYVLRTMEEAQAKVNIVILDACRNNPYTSGFRSASRGLAQMTAATGTLIAFSTAPGSIAADGTGRNGLYTQHLLASLRQPDTDILKVFQRTRAGVVKETGGKQTPWESTSLTGDFYFRPGAQVASAVPSAAAIAAPVADPEASDRAFWESVKDSKNPDEFKAYLEQFPNGQFASLARARLKNLQTTQLASVPVIVSRATAEHLVGSWTLQSTDSGTRSNRTDHRIEASGRSFKIYRYGDPEPVFQGSLFESAISGAFLLKAVLKNGGWICGGTVSIAGTSYRLICEFPDQYTLSGEVSKDGNAIQLRYEYPDWADNPSAAFRTPTLTLKEKSKRIVTDVLVRD